MATHEVREQLARLAERMDRLERRLDAVAPAPAAEPRPTPAGPSAAPPTDPTGPPTRLQAPPVPAERRDVPARRIVPPRAAMAPVAAPAERRSPLELIIGGKLAAWVGAIVIVMGAALLVHLGIESGWWGRLSELTRCLIVAAFGGGLVVAGEIVMRRISRAASVGLFGAGLGVLYLDAFATFKFWDLLGPGGSFVLMAVVAGGGFLWTWRTKFLTIGVLSLVAGYLTPLLVRGSGHELEIIVYLTAMLGVGLGLSAVRAQTFRPLRSVALAIHGVVGVGHVLVFATDHWMLAVVFMSAWWVMVLAETVFAALRGQSPVGNPVTVLAATAVYVIGGVWILAELAPTAVGDHWLGAFTTAIAALGGAAALQFGDGPNAMRDRALTAMDRLAIALWAQTGVLLAVAVALQFDGFAQTVGWLAIALAAIHVGRTLALRAVDVFGLIVGALALASVAVTGGLVALGESAGGLGTVIWETDGVVFTRWFVLACVAIAACVVAAHRLRRSDADSWRPMPIVLAALAATGWLGACVIAFEGRGATVAWLAGSAVLMVVHRFGPRQHYFEIGLAVMVTATVKWLAFDTIGMRLAHGPDGLLVLFNSSTGVGLLIAALIATVLWVSRRDGTSPVPHDVARASTPFLLGLLGAIALWIGSLEIDRAMAGAPMAVQAGLSVYWALFAVGLVVLGFARNVPVVRHAGLGLLALTVGKVLLVDLSTVERAWRVASFLVSGVLLVGTSVLYTKLSPRLITGAGGGSRPDDDADHDAAIVR